MNIFLSHSFKIFFNSNIYFPFIFW